MKKLALLGSVLALGLGFTACDGYEEPNPPAQSNPQEPVFTIENITVTDAVGDQVVDLGQYNNENKAVPMLNVDLTNFPANSTLKMVMEISVTEDFAKAYEVETSTVDGQIVVAPDDLGGVYAENISKSPRSKWIYARYSAYAVNGNESVRLGGPDKYFGPFSINLIPLPSELVIEDNYYLIGTATNWEFTDLPKFSHSDLNPYDDPVFTLAVEITADQAADGWWWKIVPESTKVAGTWIDAANASYGVAENGDDSPAGMLVARTATEDCGAGCIYEEGVYILTINLEEGTYEFSEAVPNFWTPGPANGWNFDNPMMLLATTDYENYKGYVYVDSEVKFTSAPGWDAKYNLGMGEEPGTLANGSTTNIRVDENGLYWITLNLPNLTYTTTLINTIGVIGDATPGGWDASTALNPANNYQTWTGDITFGAGEFKFRANDGWDVNLGGQYEDLVPDGANLPSPGAGVYTVTLNLSELPYTVTLTPKK